MPIMTPGYLGLDSITRLHPHTFTHLPLHAITMGQRSCPYYGKERWEGMDHQAKECVKVKEKVKFLCVILKLTFVLRVVQRLDQYRTKSHKLLCWLYPSVGV